MCSLGESLVVKASWPPLRPKGLPSPVTVRVQGLHEAAPSPCPPCPQGEREVQGLPVDSFALLLTPYPCLPLSSGRA